MNLQFRTALKHTFIGNYTILLIQFGTSLVVARLLPPEDFGLYSVALAFALLAELFRNFGVNNYIVKEKSLTLDKLESGYTILLYVAIIIGTLQFFAAAPIGGYYESETLTNILRLLVISLLISPFGAITQAQLMRDMKAKQLNICLVSSQLSASLVTLIFAWSGFGVYSLAIGFVVSNLVLVAALRLFRYDLHPQKPGYTHIKTILGFSGFVSGANVINHLGNTSQDWILGKTLGMEAVGLFARGTTTVSLYDKLVTKSLGKVLSPMIAHKQREGEALAPSCTKLISMQASIAWPFLLTMALFSTPLIELLYGEQWTAAGPVLFWLCIAKMMMMITQPSNNILMGMGLAKELFISNVIIQAVKVVSILLTMSQGLMRVVIVSAISVQVVRLFIHGYYLVTRVSILPIVLLQSLSRPLLVTLISCIPLFIIDTSTINLLTPLYGLVMCLLWLASALLLRLEIINEILSLLGLRGFRKSR